jgi:hypothetical protein
VGDASSFLEGLQPGTFDPNVPRDDPTRGLRALRRDPEAWLAEITGPEGERSPWADRGRFPSDGIRRHFLADERHLDEATRTAMLRELLPPGDAVVGSDVHHLEHLLAHDPNRLVSDQRTEYERRLIRARLGHRRPAPLPDLAWLLDLVEWQPRMAMEVTRAYLLAHGWVVNEQVVDGLHDALALVRRHYIGTAAAAGHDILAPRELEYLAGALWQARGFEVSVTGATRDGGYDVRAERGVAGERVTLLIECRSGGARSRSPLTASSLAWSPSTGPLEGS